MEIRKMKRKFVIIIAALALPLFSCNKENGDNPGPGPVPVPTDATISGCVTGSDGKKLEGVVVSDGYICTVTDKDGNYYLNSSLQGVDHVIISTPSGYAAPVADALPVYYKRIDALHKDSGGKYSGVDFTLTRIADPERFSVFFIGDPQPRSKSAGYDNFAYHSWDCCDDMCRELRETAAEIQKDHPVYGMVLGDVCHNSTALFPTHKQKMSTNGFPSYHLMGNHDHDLNAVGDKESSAAFESYFGPTNYSFNVGNIHFVALDNMIVTGRKRSTNSGEDLFDGLRDDIYHWLEQDLSYVPKDRILMICTHSPMFMVMGGKMRSRNAIVVDGAKTTSHYSDVDALVKDYAKVYAWAGHTHTTYNYAGDDAVVESHTVVRATGELWTNEYLNAGTPRGFVVMNYDNGTVSWKFHPIKYQSGSFIGKSKPSYEHRDWDFVDGVAKMKSDGSVLDESYQMHLYAPDTYAKGDGLIYANIFMWDEKWQSPYFTYNGVRQKMKRYSSSNYVYYDISAYEISDWYKQTNSTLAGADYGPSKSSCATIFTASVQTKNPAGKNSGTVSVEDRFGNTYTSTITW